jgi:hypothetical protein
MWVSRKHYGCVYRVSEALIRVEELQALDGGHAPVDLPPGKDTPFARNEL